MFTSFFNIRSPAVFAGLAVLANGWVSPGLHAQDTNLAYAVSDGTDELVEMNRFDGSAFNVIGSIGVANIEAIGWDVGGNALYGANAGQFGSLNLSTGAFTAIGSGFGTAGGARGEIPMDDADGLAVDPLTTIMYASNRETDGSPDDVLFQVNLTTGAHIPDAFGPGVDYVVIDTSSLPVVPVIYDVDDIGIDATDGQMYGIANDGGGGDRLVEIDKATGTVTDVGRLRLADMTGVDDIEGMAFFNDGTMYVVTGNSGTAATNERLWEVDKATGIMTEIGQFGSGSDYESTADLTAPANTITGTVFEDVNADGNLDGGDTPDAGVTVNLYLDVNGDGMVDGGDVFLQTVDSAGDGTYSFLVGSDSDFVVEVDQGDFPPAATGMTTPSEYGVEFTGFGNTSADNDFGWITNGFIGDTIYWDLDMDGMQDPGEPGIEGVDVLIDTPTMGQVTVTTNASGMYTHIVAETGSHDVTVDTATLPHDFSQTADPDATLDDTTTVSIATLADVVLTADFGYEFRYLDKQVDKALASDGDTITYSLYPRYYGDDLLSNVTVTDAVPAGTTFVSAGQGGSESGGTVTWNLGSTTAGVPSSNNLSATVYGLRGNVTTNFYSYDPVGDNWTTLANTPGTVDGGGALAYDGTYLYALRGGTTDFYRYDIGGNSWSSMASIPGSTNDGAALSHVAGKIYALRGTVAPSFYEYDIAGNSWSSLANVPGNVDDGGALVELGGYLYAFRGRTADFYRYDIGGNSWSTMASAPAAIDGGGSLSTDGTYLYAFRGNVNTTFYRYDVGGNSWSTMASAPATVDHGGALSDANGGVIYGVRGSTSASFYEYDISGNSWSSLANVPGTVEWGGALKLVGGGGGYDASLTASPSLVSDGDTITITLTLGSSVALTGVAPPALTVAGTNGALATYVSGPTPASSDITAGGSADFTYVYTATDGATPGEVTFTVPTFSSAGGDWLTADANSVIVSPALTFQVTVDAGASSPIANTGAIVSDTFIPSTNSNTVETVIPPAVMGNRVWLDEDGDGEQDAGEDGIGGVTVELLNGAMTVIDTAVTDHEGGYLFGGLSGGTYTVRVDTATLPAGLAANQTGDPDVTFDDEHTVAIVAGDEFFTGDFGYNWVPALDTTVPVLGTTGAIGDRLWIDADGDGVQDAGEAGIPGVSVRLLTDDNGDGTYGGAGDSPAVTTATDDTGHYIFDGLSPDAYVVEVVTGTLPAGYTQTGDPDATLDDMTDPLPLAPGDVMVNADFGYQPAAGSDIGDTIYFDADADSTQDAGEAGIAGVSVTLLDASGDPLANTVTDASGNYLFPGLPAGVYSVVITDAENVLSDLASTQDPDGGGDRQSAVVADGTTDELGQDFGFAPAGHATGEGLIGDTVFIDRDADGLLDAGEGIEGIRVDLYNEPGTVLITSVRTDENGRYAFGDLDPIATYTVRVNTADLPPGLTNTVDPDGGTASEAVVDLSAGSGVDLDQDFGYRDTSSPNTIGGTVWEDTDADGTLDEAGAGIAGVTVVLRDGSGDILGTTTTDGSGNYSFANLPDGSFTVEVVDEGNSAAGAWKSTGTSPGADNNSQVKVYSVTVSGGQTNTTGDFGFYGDPTATGNFVFNDIDQDGLQDVGEPGIGGVVVRLTITYPTTDAVILTTTTDGSGNYSFGNLLLDENFDGVGTMLVDEPEFEITVVAAPPGGAPSPIDVGGDDSIDSDDGVGGEVAEPTQGAADTTNDFGFTGPKLQTNYSDWADFNGLTGGGAAPTANPDGDLYDNLNEYAFCLDPNTGVEGDKNFCVAESMTVPGQFDAFFTRATGLTDLTYTLEGIADLAGSPGGWADMGITPTIVDNGDGTEMVTYEDLESVLSSGIGFVRVKVDLSSPVTTAYTEVFGWERTGNAIGCETCSAPFLQKPEFSGVVDSMTLSNLEVAGSAGSGDVKAAMDGMETYFVEVVSGANEGHRFEVDYTSSDADTIAIDTGSAYNTLSPVPDLSGQSVVLRPFWTLGELFDTADFDATNDPDTADRLLFRSPGTAGTWQVIYLLDAPLQWTEQGDIGMADQGGRIIDPCEGMFVHRRATAGDFLVMGMVRANDFACPLLEGHNLVTSGWAMDLNPVERAMQVGGGFFFGGIDPAAVDQTHFWLGDETPGDEGYEGFFLLDDGGSYQYWTGLGDSNVTDEDATDLFHSNRSALIRVSSDRLNYVMPLPWTP